MSIPALDGISALGSLGSLSGTAGAGSSTAVAGTGYLGATSPAEAAASSSAFGSTLTGAIENLQGLQDTSNELAIKAVTGDLDDVHDYTVASSQAKLTLELTAAIRNKAVEAFSEIMRMQA